MMKRLLSGCQAAWQYFGNANRGQQSEPTSRALGDKARLMLRPLFFFFCTFPYTVLHGAVLEGLRVLESSGKSTSIYFMLNGAATPKVFTLANPNRLVVDFPATDVRFAMSDVALSKQMVLSVRNGKPSPQVTRLVFELKSPVGFTHHAWTPPVSGRQGFEIKLSSYSTPTQPRPAPTAPSVAVRASAVGVTRAPTPRLEPLPRNAPVLSARRGGARDVVVAIDAGHGGKDPGAIGPSRFQEKNATLGIALKLKQVIDRQPGMKAVLTRRGDYYVPLRERLNIARRAKADIFVSIHADAFKNKQSHGASVFALSPRGATSEAARWLAEKENYSELGGVNLKGLDDSNGWVRSVLIDLSQTATINASLMMGQEVLKELGGFAHLHNHRVEQAGFLVLKSPDTPSILVETGFISNPQEERNLASYTYQHRLANAIFKGVYRYFMVNPPHGSRFEAASAK